ncbi:MAG: DUF1805 domain-containing protein [Verrucomicrobia bacterium]|nr:DUF1805 domain-containing protein [Verrucomicrobiota bacterium]
MPIHTAPLHHAGVAAESLEVSWDGGQFVLIIAPKGLVACGVVDPAVMNRFGAAVAVARGTPEHPLVTAGDLLAARVAEVTEAAAARGIAAGMTGADALARLG